MVIRLMGDWPRSVHCDGQCIVQPNVEDVVGGTLRRRAHAVRLAAVEAVEIEQTLVGQLLGYGTVVVGPLALDHLPKPKSVYRLVERLAE